MGTYLNRGMYDAVEAAHLVEVSPAQIVRWAQPTTQRPAVVTASLDGGLYSFHDLITLKVVAQLVKRRLTLRTIANGLKDLEQRLETDHPLAHQAVKLGTVGAAFFAESGGEWIDVGRGGQGAFQQIVGPALKGVEYGADHLANLWRPADRVSLNPRVQAGAACIDRTRIPTAVIYQVIEHGDHPVNVAEDYDLALEDVVAAHRFEQRLARAA